MSTLASMYDSLKSATDKPAPLMNNMGKDLNDPKAVQWTNLASREADKLSDGCAKKVLLDIYCRIIPLDSEFVTGHKGMMKRDVDSFLTNKNQTATQYFQSCHEKTKSPLLEFIIRSCDNIGKKFMEDAKETLKDAQKNGLDIPPPVADVDSPETESQLVDIVGTKDKPADIEYEEFIDKIKKKTIKRVISEVSDLINTKKYSADTDTNFADVKIDDTLNVKADTKSDTKNKKSDAKDSPDMMEESVISIAADWLSSKLWNESITADQQELIIGAAIREATFNIIDTTFQQPSANINSYRTRIRLGKGVIINESTINDIRNSK